MHVLERLGLLNSEIINMIEICPEISLLSHDEIFNNIQLLKKIDLEDSEIKEILIINPFLLNRNYIDIYNLIIKLSSIGIRNIDSLVTINPFLLSKEAYEIDEYIHSGMEKGSSIQNLIEALIQNPYVIEEI